MKNLKPQKPSVTDLLFEVRELVSSPFYFPVITKGRLVIACGDFQAEGKSLRKVLSQLVEKLVASPTVEFLEHIPKTPRSTCTHRQLSSAGLVAQATYAIQFDGLPHFNCHFYREKTSIVLNFASDPTFTQLREIFEHLPKLDIPVEIETRIEKQVGESISRTRR